MTWQPHRPQRQQALGITLIVTDKINLADPDREWGVRCVNPHCRQVYSLAECFNCHNATLALGQDKDGDTMYFCASCHHGRLKWTCAACGTQNIHSTALVSQPRRSTFQCWFGPYIPGIYVSQPLFRQGRSRHAKRTIFLWLSIAALIIIPVIVIFFTQ